MFLSDTTKQMILEDLQLPNADVQRVSRLYGIPVRIIRELACTDFVPPEFAELYGGWGRPELQKFVVTRVRAGDDWPLFAHYEIEKARQDYDLGLSEMCQGRDGQWIILYSIPRIHPEQGRLPYFSREFGE
jgi:hypothetical protein